jgi:bifunctional DNA-binding transcriptional regulator/antitoxin component of YhaV-PrlF toxin-antitoxin module
MARAKAASAVTETAIVGDRGRLTIPGLVRQAVRLEPGQVVQLEVVDENTITMHVQTLVPRDQAWILTPTWKSRIREGVEDIGAGRVAKYDSDEAFLASLED